MPSGATEAGHWKLPSWLPQGCITVAARLTIGCITVARPPKQASHTVASCGSDKAKVSIVNRACIENKRYFLLTFPENTHFTRYETQRRPNSRTFRRLSHARNSPRKTGWKRHRERLSGLTRLCYVIHRGSRSQRSPTSPNETDTAEGRRRPADTQKPACRR